MRLRSVFGTRDSARYAGRAMTAEAESSASAPRPPARDGAAHVEAARHVGLAEVEIRVDGQADERPAVVNDQVADRRTGRRRTASCGPTARVERLSRLSIAEPAPLAHDRTRYCGAVSSKPRGPRRQARPRFRQGEDAFPSSLRDSRACKVKPADRLRYTAEAGWGQIVARWGLFRASGACRRGQAVNRERFRP